MPQTTPKIIKTDLKNGLLIENKASLSWDFSFCWCKWEYTWVDPRPRTFKVTVHVIWLHPASRKTKTFSLLRKARIKHSYKPQRIHDRDLHFGFLCQGTHPSTSWHPFQGTWIMSWGSYVLRQEMGFYIFLYIFFVSSAKILSHIDEDVSGCSRDAGRYSSVAGDRGLYTCRPESPPPPLLTRRL